MKQKLTIMVITIVLAFGLVGCTAGGPKLPEGDVKIMQQKMTGVVNLIMQSADYGNDKSAISSVILPAEAKYDIQLVMEKYIDGKLTETKDIMKYTTGTIEKNSIIHVMTNTGKIGDKENTKSIYSIAEIDKEKTTDKKNPEFKITKAYGDTVAFDAKSQLDSKGGSLGEDFAVIGLVKYKDGDTQKKAIDLGKYKDEVSKYKEANIIKLKAIKK